MANLQDQAWKISNEVRCSVEGWDLRQYILGFLFYRFVSEKFSDSIPECYNFNSLASNASENPDLISDLYEALYNIENFLIEKFDEESAKDLFIDLNFDNRKLGNKTSRVENVANIISGVKDFDLDNLDLDIFGDLYEFLISKYAANAGKSGGEYFTPSEVAKLIAKLAMQGKNSISKVYDPTCGSGSLLLKMKDAFDNGLIRDGFFGQDSNSTSYNLARMNMITRNIPHDKFCIKLGDTLENPHFLDESFDIIVSNPPYSIKWGNQNHSKFLEDKRFKPAGVLAPKSKADFAFIMHILHYLSDIGRAVIICFPGILYRANSEYKIRKYLVDNNFVEAVINLPANLFFSTTIAVSVLILSKNKTNTDIHFIDASGAEFFKQEVKKNILLDEHISKILDIVAKKESISNISKIVKQDDVIDRNYTLSVSTYVAAKDTREKIDITKLNAEIAETVRNIDDLRKSINTIIKEIEG